MESTHTKKIQAQVIRQEPATEKQIRLLETIARNVGMKINTDTMTKEESTKDYSPAHAVG